VEMLLNLEKDLLELISSEDTPESGLDGIKDRCPCGPEEGMSDCVTCFQV
jgi:hypothetical protein